MSIRLETFSFNVQITSTSATSRQLLYTADNGVAQIDQISIKNNNAASQDVYIYFKSDATLSGTVVDVLKKSVGAGTTANASELVGHKIPANATIQVHSTHATDTYITISGMERPQ